MFPYQQYKLIHSLRKCLRFSLKRSTNRLVWIGLSLVKHKYLNFTMMSLTSFVVQKPVKLFVWFQQENRDVLYLRNKSGPDQKTPGQISTLTDFLALQYADFITIYELQHLSRAKSLFTCQVQGQNSSSKQIHFIFWKNIANLDKWQNTPTREWSRNPPTREWSSRRRCRFCLEEGGGCWIAILWQYKLGATIIFFTTTTVT